MPKPFIDRNSADIMARTICGEARGEGRLGRIAVGWVIRNRAELDLDGRPETPNWWGEGIEGVCKRPGQFSCWNEKDPNRPKILALTRKDFIYLECLDAALSVLSGEVLDPTRGSTHYHAAHVHPSWANAHKPATIVGNHLFYNTVR